MTKDAYYEIMAKLKQCNCVNCLTALEVIKSLECENERLRHPHVNDELWSKIAKVK